jgi:hypothetical protein
MRRRILDYRKLWIALGDAAVASVGGVLLSRRGGEGWRWRRWWQQPITGGALGPGVLNFLLRNAQVGTMSEASNAAQPNHDHAHTDMLCR